MHNNTPTRCAFVVSPNQDVVQKIKAALPSTYEMRMFLSATEFLEHLHLCPSIIFLDDHIKDRVCANLIHQIKEFDEHILSIVISNNNNPTKHDLLFQVGVYDCFVKSELALPKFQNALTRIEKLLKLNDKLKSLKSKILSSFTPKMVTDSPPMRRVAALIHKAALTNITCYITGKTGTGKGVVAHTIHSSSDRQHSPYISLNLSSASNEDIEMMLFGVEKGGLAKTSKPGKLELAEKGTLYLKEISSLDTLMQAKLLEVLRKGSFSRIGGKESIPFRARLIVSTRKNLYEEMARGNFREDLYYSLTGLPIPIPELHERGNDILLLAKNLLQQFLKNNNITEKKFSNEAMKKLLSYSFPGNVRELKSIVERAAAFASHEYISEEDIDFLDSPSQLKFLDEELTFEEYKSKIIHHFLEKYNNDILMVSNKLDIGKSTIYRMLKSEKEKSKKQFSWS